METRQSKIKLPLTVRTKSPGLLPMLYTLRELCEELDVPDSTLRGWLQAGAPHSRDERSHLWVNGESFADWVKAQQKPGKHRKLAEHEAYCLHCNQIVQLKNPEVHPVKGKLIHIRGICPECGHVIVRGGRNDRTTKLS